MLGFAVSPSDETRTSQELCEICFPSGRVMGLEPGSYLQGAPCGSVTWRIDLHGTKAEDAGWPDCLTFKTEIGDVLVATHTEFGTVLYFF